MKGSINKFAIKITFGNIHKIAVILIISLGIIIIFGGFFLYKKHTQPTQYIISSKGCDASLWKYIHSPKRLKVLNKCISVTGVIVSEKKEPDGDLHLGLKLDAQYEKLLNAKNRTSKGSALVLEAICEHKATQKDSKKICLKYKGDVENPPIGSRVTVVGSYVLDRYHGWNEIHPASSLKILK